MRSGGARSTKAVIARDVAVAADRADRRARRAAAAAAPASARATATPSTGSSAPRRSCSSRSTATSCAPTRSPGRRRARATPTTDARLAAELHRQHEEPGRAPRRDRHGARHAAPLLQLPRLGARAVDRDRRQRAAPRHPDRGAALRALRRTCSSSPACCRRRRRSAAIHATEALELIASVEGFERGRYGGAVGWVDADGQRHVGGRHPLRRAVAPTGARPACSPAAASSPTAIHTPSWPRRRPSSKRCCPPSSAPDAPRSGERSTRRQTVRMTHPDGHHDRRAATAALSSSWTSTFCSRSVGTRTSRGAGWRARRRRRASTWVTSSTSRPCAAASASDVGAVGRAEQLLEPLA